MKKILILSAVVISIISLAIIISACSGSRNSNDAAERDKNGRYLTIINDTRDNIINEIHVFVGEGTEINAMERINPDEKSISIEIPDEYSEHTAFTVVLISLYDFKYVKEVTDVPAKGRTEVKITEANYVKEKGDLWDEINKWMNGD